MIAHFAVVVLCLVSTAADPKIQVAPDVESGIYELGKSVTVSYDAFQTIVGPRPAGSVFLVPTAGVSAARLADTVRSARLADNLKVWDTDQLAAEFAHDFKGFLVPFWLLARGLLIVAFIAVLGRARRP